MTYNEALRHAGRIWEKLCFSQRVAVFIVDGRVRTADPNSSWGSKYSRCYGENLVGIYTPGVGTRDIADDIYHYSLEIAKNDH